MQFDAKDTAVRPPVVYVMVVVPTYNERENIERLVPQLLDLDLGSQSHLSVCVVDDNSPDGTGAYADQLARASQRVSVVHRVGKLGLGTAYIAGMRHAMAHGADAVLTMDADFSHHPRYIPAMVAALPNAGLVIGSRYVPGGKVLYPLYRRMLSRGANAFARFTLGLRARDCTAGFRLYRRTVLESIDLDGIFSNGYSFLVEMLFAVQQCGWKVAEVPIVFEDRKYGQSKISRNEILKAVYTCMRLLARRLLGSQMRPNTEIVRSK
ncbi:MAG: polyprenol monophosphomannose synthase [Chloroflexi bacterium]|nr:polyprenol monophosphomannose synthase [Chloroflexota bacterium]